MTHVTPKEQPTLKERRGARSLAEVAEKIGVSSRTLRRWENDETRPLADELLRLAEYYRVHPKNLFPERVPATTEAK